MARQTWLGMDPGTANFAVTVFRYDTKTGKSKTLYVSMIANPIKNLTDSPIRPIQRRGKSTLERDEPTFDVGMTLFAHEIEWLFETFGITHVVGERFQVRGKFGGDGIELINVMLGTVFTIARMRGAKFMTTTAGVWKNAVARQGGNLPLLYEHGKIQYKLEPHVIDSTLIAKWHADKGVSWATKPKLLQQIHACLQNTASVY